jgi:septal ring factor EnvC (AmiA/AmiB activator)
MLQNMQKQIAKEAEHETELFEKYMCYCKNSGGTLQDSIDAAKTKIPQLEAALKGSAGKKIQLEADIKDAKAGRKAAKEAMSEATAIREKEKAAFDKETADDKTNIAAMDKAIAALAAGMEGAAFVQTPTGSVLKKIVQTAKVIDETDREDVLSFLSGTDSYAPQSGQIVGILKQMNDEMKASLKEATDAEDAAVKVYEELMAAKKKEVAALSKEIEEKLERVAKIGVENAEMANDLEDTKESLVEDEKFLADLEKNCKTKQAEWDAIKANRAEELVALADTIKVLNDDDALELFKKTLPSASASFVQMEESSRNMRAQALAIVQKANRPGLDFIALALHSKKIGFDKIIKMIDELVATLKQEQKDDDDKKSYCNDELDKSDDKKKELERSVKDLETAIAHSEEGIAALEAEIEALGAAIKALDKSVAEATAQRQEEHAAFKELMANDGAAKEVLAFARNRLNKFYNPKLYKAPPKRELSEEDRITVNMGGTLAATAAPGGIAGTGIEAMQVKAAPPPPPESFKAYTKKSEESNGVIAMINLLVKDLDKEMTESKTEEKDAQEAYEKAMADAKEKRAQDSKSLTDKQGAKADMQSELEQQTTDKKSTEKELGATLQYIHQLHGECDWLLKYFDARTEARANEINSLGNAKAVLSGADYSLVETTARRSLRKR